MRAEQQVLGAYKRGKKQENVQRRKLSLLALSTSHQDCGPGDPSRRTEGNVSLACASISKNNHRLISGHLQDLLIILWGKNVFN